MARATPFHLVDVLGLLAYAHVPDELDRRAAQHLDEMFSGDEERSADNA